MSNDSIERLVERAKESPWAVAIESAAVVRRIARRRRRNRYAAAAGASVAALGIAAWAIPQMQPPESEIAVAAPDGAFELSNGTTIVVPNGWHTTPGASTEDTHVTCLNRTSDDRAEACSLEVRAMTDETSMTETNAPAQVAVEDCDERADPRPITVDHLQVPTGPASHFIGSCYEGSRPVSVWALDSRALVIKVADAKWDPIARGVLASATDGLGASPAEPAPSTTPDGQ